GSLERGPLSATAHGERVGAGVEEFRDVAAGEALLQLEVPVALAVDDRAIRGIGRDGSGQADGRPVDRVGREIEGELDGRVDPLRALAYGAGPPQHALPTQGRGRGPDLG